MSALVYSIPVFLMIALEGLGISPKSKTRKMLLNISTIAIGLLIGFPISVAIFPALTIKNGKDIEDRFH